MPTLEEVYGPSQAASPATMGRSLEDVYGGQGVQSPPPPASPPQSRTLEEVYGGQRVAGNPSPKTGRSIEEIYGQASSESVANATSQPATGENGLLGRAGIGLLDQGAQLVSNTATLPNTLAENVLQKAGVHNQPLPETPPKSLLERAVDPIVNYFMPETSEAKTAREAEEQQTWNEVRGVIPQSATNPAQLQRDAIHEAIAPAPLPPPANIAEKAVDIGTGLVGTAAEIALDRKLLPESLPKTGPVGDAAAWELQNQASGGAPGTGALMGGTVGAIGKAFPAAPVKTAIGEGFAFGVSTYLTTGNVKESLINGLLPAAMKTPAMISWARGRLESAPTPEARQHAIDSIRSLPEDAKPETPQPPTGESNAVSERPIQSTPQPAQQNPVDAQGEGSAPSGNVAPIPPATDTGRNSPGNTPQSDVGDRVRPVDGRSGNVAGGMAASEQHLRGDNAPEPVPQPPAGVNDAPPAEEKSIDATPVAVDDIGNGQPAQETGRTEANDGSAALPGSERPAGRSGFTLSPEESSQPDQSLNSNDSRQVGQPVNEKSPEVDTGENRKEKTLPPPDNTKNAPASEEPELPEGSTSARNISTDADRESLGLDQLASPPKESWKTALDTAKKEVTPEKAMRIAAEVNDNPRSMTTIETAGLVAHAAKLKNEHSALLDQIEKATDPADIKTKGAEAGRIEQEFDHLSRALRASGTKEGQQLAIRKLTIDRDMNLLAVKARAKAAKGDELSAKQSDQFAQLTKEHAEVVKRLADLEQQVKDNSANNSLRESRARKYSRMSPEEKNAELSSNYEKLRSLLKGGCHSN